jgi:hypothetical protein
MPSAGDALPALTALAEGPPSSLQADGKPMTE